MTTFEMQQKERNIESFNATVALYYVLKSNSASMRVKQAVYRADEVECLPVDFIIDVELKTQRILGQPFYDMFQRAVYNENTEILPERMRETLGRIYQEYGLTPEGSYRRLYYNVKNDQVRSYLKEQKNGTGIFRATDEPDCSFDFGA